MSSFVLRWGSYTLLSPAWYQIIKNSEKACFLAGAFTLHMRSKSQGGFMGAMNSRKCKKINNLKELYCWRITLYHLYWDPSTLITWWTLWNIVSQLWMHEPPSGHRSQTEDLNCWSASSQPDKSGTKSEWIAQLSDLSNSSSSRQATLQHLPLNTTVNWSVLKTVCCGVCWKQPFLGHYTRLLRHVWR